MIIKDIRLINFGKFNEREVDIKPGLNIIYGENEAGKTTIHTFIRAMLFGLDKPRGKSSSKDLFSKYEPWDNPSNYQGSMRIENNGVNYRIERNFSREHRVFRVINEDEGRQLENYEIDQLFDGLDENCYYNTVSISQLGSSTDKELELILKNYAANLGATRTIDINIKDALLDLDTQRKNIIKDNKINDEILITNEIKEATNDLELSDYDKQSIISNIEEKKKELSILKGKKSELTVLDSKRLEEMARHNERKDNLYQEALVNTTEVNKYTAALEQVTKQKEDINNELKSRGVEDASTVEMLTTKIMNRTSMPIVLIILLMACFGAGIGFIVGNYSLLHLKQYWIKPGACLGAAVIFTILAIGKYFYNNKKKTKKLLALKDLKDLLVKLEATNHEEVYIKRQLDSKKELLDRTQQAIKVEDDNAISATDYSDELKELEEKERSLEEAISKNQWSLEQKQEKDIEIGKRIEELTNKHNKLARAKEEIKAIEAAKIDIEELSNEIRNSFGKKLNEKASNYMSKITNGKYNSLTIDEKLNISINSKNSLFGAAKLSKGTIEQVYMSLRLAAADIIFEKDKKPILLDDAFVMYDNKRMGNTLKFMSENMDQVLLFSCHTREKVMADKLKLDYNFIRL